MNVSVRTLDRDKNNETLSKLKVLLRHFLHHYSRSKLLLDLRVSSIHGTGFDVSRILGVDPKFGSGRPRSNEQDSVM